MMAQMLHGDCLAVMPTLGAASVDAIVCDPPYGLGFMGKTWDHGVPGVPFWMAALRVAKPGAHLVAFGGTRTFHRLTCAIEDAGWDIRDCLSWLYGSGFPKSHNGAWGGTALKPAWEPIVLARKPPSGTVSANVAAHGTGALNIDGCRIEGAGRPAREPGKLSGFADVGKSAGSRAVGTTDVGRWPANVVLDEEAAAMLDAASGEITARIGKPRGAGAGDGWGMTLTGAEYDDTGGASRFFYCAKASRAERDEGIGTPAVRRTDGRGTDIENPRLRTSPRANHHATVKPVALMRWLCRLVTPPGGVILDPFMGSGSTGVAAVTEGFRFVGIEQDAGYVEIARARVAAATHQPDLDFGGAA